MYLETLSGWVRRSRPDLEAAGFAIQLSERMARTKPSQGLSVSARGREAEIRVWVSGECDVMIGDVTTGAVEVTHHDLQSDDELLTVLDAFGSSLTL
jgi:hypothetical protein